MRVLSFIIAVILLAASVALLYPEILHNNFNSDQINDVLSTVSADESVFEKMRFGNFPFYNSVESVCEDYKPFVNGETTEIPDFGSRISGIFKGEGVLEKLYSFCIIALMSIPIYMILRLIPYNSLFGLSDDSFVVFRPLVRGLFACSCSVTSVTVTWFIYHTLIYEKLAAWLTDLITNFSKPEIALTFTNLLLIIVGVVAVIGFLKITIFRGSFFLSILTAVLRTLLFVTTFAIINTFIGCKTLNVILLGLAFIFLVGLLDMIIEPAKRR